jgi:2-oxoglutarate ferredoxin oxidoreductase subunit beta
LNVCLIDILQNCISFIRLNTFHWYKEHVYELKHDHDLTDRIGAFRRSLEWGEKIPTGIFYINKRSTLEQNVPVIREKPLEQQPFSMETVTEETQTFY